MTSSSTAPTTAAATTAKKRSKSVAQTDRDANDDNESTQPPPAKRKTTKPTRLSDEQANPTLSNPKSQTLKSATITLYESQPLPTRDAKTGELIFDDYPLFRPNLTPSEILQVCRNIRSIHTLYLLCTLLHYTPC